MMNQRALFAVLLTLSVVTPTLSGCFGSEPEPEEIVEEGPFSFSEEIPIETFYHFPGAIDAMNESAPREHLAME